MTETDHTPIRLAALPRTKPHRFRLEPDAPTRRALAEELGILDVKKLRFDGELRPEGKANWRLEAALGATVVQPCVATLAPVTTRIDETIARAYLANFEEPEGGAEVEMPEDDSAESLPDTLDLGVVMAEALALALPLYPRADGADPVEAQASAPGVAPLTDEDVKPFAGLAALRDQLKDGEEN